MSPLNRRLADLEEQNPVKFVIPDIWMPVESIDAAQAMWIALMVPGQSKWRSAALRKFNAKEFAAFALNDAALGSFVDSLSKEALDALADGLAQTSDDRSATGS